MDRALLMIIMISVMLLSGYYTFSSFDENNTIFVDKSFCWKYSRTDNNNCHLDMWDQ